MPAAPRGRPAEGGRQARVRAERPREDVAAAGRVASDGRASTLELTRFVESVASSPRQVAQQRTVAVVQRQPGHPGRSGLPGRSGSGPQTGEARRADLVQQEGGAEHVPSSRRAVVVQQVATVQRVSAADLDALRDDVLGLCDAGGAVAWDLYRAGLQLVVDETKQRQGRMSGLGPGTEGAGRLAGERAAAEQAFRDLAARVRAVARQEAGRPDVGVAILRQVGDEVRAELRRIGDRAFVVGVKAESEGHIIAARHAFRGADRAEIAAGEKPSASTADVRRGGGGRGAREVLAGDVYGTAIDTGANTVLGGTAGNVASGFGAVASEGTLAFNVGFGAGAVFGPLAVMCSTIDLVLSVRSAVTTAERRRQMEELAGTLSGAQGREIALYAAEQKEKKLGRRVGMSVGAALGLAAGIGACVALGVASFGIGALVMGVVAASVGMGFLIYRIARKSKWARTRKMIDMARHLSQAARDPDDAEAQQLALQQIRNLGLQDPADHRGIAAALAAQATSRRTLTAEWLVLLLTDGTRSERRDAALILEGLRLDPPGLRGLVESGEGARAVEKVAGKLASW